MRLRTNVHGQMKTLTITDVEYVPGLKKTLLSYGILESKGVRLAYRNGEHLLAHDKGATVAEVHKTGQLLVVRALRDGSLLNAAMICNASETQDHILEVHEDSLYNFHLRLGHVHYDAILKVAEDPQSGIKLTDEVRQNCMICSEGKQTRNPQSKKDSGENAPINRIGGVICSDLKGPITPKDRQGNRYVVNFIDYKSNYVRCFVAKTKDQAAKKFEQFVQWFERKYNSTILILRTDGGGEYANVDLFCQTTGIGRQTTEAKSSASNGKAERMHRCALHDFQQRLANAFLG